MFHFPSTITCFDTSWATSVEDVRYHAQETMSYNRDNPFRQYYKDFDYTLNSNKWIIPWLKNYFFQTALLMISFSMLIISSIILLIMNFKKFSKPEPIEYLIGLVFIFIFGIWYLSPEIRYVSGLIISAGTILIVYIIFNSQLNNQILPNI